MFQNKLSYLILVVLLPHSLLATNPNTVVGIVTDESPATIDGAYFLAVSPNGQKIYVSNLSNSSVSVIDVATNTVTGIVNDPSSTFHDNYGVVFNPNGQTAYVMNSGSNPYSISIINTATNTVTGTINSTAAALDAPFNMAITPDGNYGYVSGGSYVTVVDLLTNATTQNITLPVSAEVVSITITPDGTKAYACLYSGELYVIDLVTNTVIATVAGSFGQGYGSAITPDGATLYIANLDTSTVSIIDTATNTQTGIVTDLNPATINFPFALAITPDGSTLYVANESGSSVSIVDTATNAVTGIVTDLNPTTINFPIDMIVTPNGATGYVLNGNNTISIVYISTPLSPPSNFTGCKSADVFLLQEDLVNILSWNSPSGGTAPASYNIYSNTGLTQLVANVSASGPLKYIDHNRAATGSYSYYIVSVDSQSGVSAPASVTVNQNCA